MPWQVYLSGEIHTDWRERIVDGADAPASTSPSPARSPTTRASDDCGAAILGAQSEQFWHDHLGAGVNAIRTRTLLERADVVVVRFGEQYRQWNAAFDAGYAAALGKPLVTLHPPEHDHALKEVDRAALAVAREPEQVVDILRYVVEGTLVASARRARRADRRRPIRKPTSQRAADGERGRVLGARRWPPAARRRAPSRACGAVRRPSPPRPSRAPGP